jgi:hypothetical protein
MYSSVRSGHAHITHLGQVETAPAMALKLCDGYSERVSDTNSPLPPILVANLFPEISHQLIQLLRSLSLAEWQLPTMSSQRCVKDIVSHLLDGCLRRLSMHRDGYFTPDASGRQQAEETLTEFLNRLNSQWEIGARRISPQVLVDLLELSDRNLAESIHLRLRFFRLRGQEKKNHSTGWMSLATTPKNGTTHSRYLRPRIARARL